MLIPTGARRSDPQAPLRHVDLTLVATALAIASLGALMVYSATRTRLEASGLDPQYFLKRQLLWLALGVLAMVLSMAIDYRTLRDAAPIVYGAVVLALLAVLSPLGAAAKGAQRWFSIGGFQLQPAAFATLALVLSLAAVCHRTERGFGPRELVIAIGLALVCIVLVVPEPDLGTALVLGVIMMTVLTIAGARPRQLVILLLAAATVVLVASQLGVLRHYQTARLTAFLDQTHGRAQALYNLNQSKIAIASGGLAGKGLFHGTQTNLAFVPEQHTDFIFTAVGEQLGFVGAASLLALFATLVWRVWRTAKLARDSFGVLLCAGVLGMLVFELFENAGMTMGIMPITGIPLPLMSYGGSATVVTFMAVGLVANVHMRRFV